MVCGVVFVIWKWAWVGDEVDSDNDTSDSSLKSSLRVIPETPNESLDEPESEPELLLANVSSKPLTIQTVTFKCIGCTKECYRKALAKASKLMSSGQDVPCVLYPDPQNPVDSRAIAFKLTIENCWQRIGYVVREVQEEVHTALQNDAITIVSIDRIKYVLHWKEPGYYAGINISRRGEWSKTVTRSQSAKL